MTRRLATFAGLLLLPAALAAQAPVVQQAQTAYDELRYGDAIRQARAATGQQLSQADLAQAFEILAFAYAALDSTPQAVAAFKELIFLDPDREPDVNVVAPRIVNAYTAALSDVLVVRRTAIADTSIVAGQGRIPVTFEVSRPSRAVVRMLGPQGYDVTVDSFLVSRRGFAEWSAQTADGVPAPEGAYRVIITATERDNQHAAQSPFVLTHAPVDTTRHLLALPGQDPLPESERPPRDWRPLGVAVLYAGIGAGATLALDQVDLFGGPQDIVGGVSVIALISGFVASLRRPDPRPVPANIRYNQLLRDELARRNQAIAQGNLARRMQIRLTVTPTGGDQ